MLARTQQASTDIILIIDEAHSSSTTPLAEEEIKTINPKIIIKITATHREKVNLDVHVTLDDVRRSGLIVEDIELQKSAEFESADESLDQELLWNALKKTADTRK